MIDTMHAQLVASGPKWKLYRGDLRDAKTLRSFPAKYFDACLSDPPYGLSPDGVARTWDEIDHERARGGFMNKAWDAAVPGKRFWKSALRVLKPGAHVLAFSGTRTAHRATCAIEDAGFQVRDVLMLLFAKGFPKSLNVSLAIDNAAGAAREVVGTRTLTGNAAISTADKGGTYGVQVGSGSKEIDVTAPATDDAKRFAGYGTALKPAYEPICLARKPLAGTVVETVLSHGTGALNIDGCRIATDWSDRSEAWKRSGHSAKPDAEKIAAPPGAGINCHDGGRWPANVLLQHAEECAEKGLAAFDCVPDCPVQLLDELAGERTSGFMRSGTRRSTGGGYNGHFPAEATRADTYGDSGGASRFFFCSKVSTREREFGCEGLPLRSAGEVTDREEDSDGLESPRSGAGRGGGARNHHPTLKSIQLCTWLARLILPPPHADGSPRRLLVPFAGAGSEMIGAIRAGWDEVIGVENDPDYLTIAEARLRRWDEVPHHVWPFDEPKSAPVPEAQVDLFSRIAGGGK